MATLSTVSGYPYPATSETPDVQRDLKALVDYLEARTVPQTFTPTWTGTGAARGNGTLTGWWVKTGRLTTVYAKLTLGSTTTMGTVSQQIASLPWTNTSTGKIGAQVRFTRGSTDWMGQGVIYASGSSVFVAVPGTNGAWTQITSTVPFTWATGDTLEVLVTYPTTT